MEQLDGRGAYKHPFNALKKELGIPATFHWHDLRHSYETLMAKYGANPKKLAEILGHSSEEMGKTYIDTSQIPVSIPKAYADFLDEVIPLDMDTPVYKITGNTFLEDIMPDGI